MVSCTAVEPDPQPALGVCKIAVSHDGATTIGLRPALHYKILACFASGGVSFTAHDTYTHDVDFHPANQTFATIGYDLVYGCVRLWANQLKLWETPCDGGLLRFSPDGQRIATASHGNGGTITVIAAATGTITKTYTFNLPQTLIRCLAFAFDNKTIATGHVDWSIRLSDAATGDVLSAFSPCFEPTQMVFLPNGTHFVVAPNIAGTMCLCTLAPPMFEEWAAVAPVISLACSANGAWIAAAHGTKEVTLWSATTMQAMGVVVFQMAVRAVAFWPNHNCLLGATEIGIEMGNLPGEMNV